MEFLALTEQITINMADVRKVTTWVDPNNNYVACVQFTNGQDRTYTGEAGRSVAWYVSHNAVPAYELADRWVTLK